MWRTHFLSFGAKNHGFPWPERSDYRVLRMRTEIYWIMRTKRNDKICLENRVLWVFNRQFSASHSGDFFFQISCILYASQRRCGRTTITIVIAGRCTYRCLHGWIKCEIVYPSPPMTGVSFPSGPVVASTTVNWVAPTGKLPTARTLATGLPGGMDSVAGGRKHLGLCTFHPRHCCYVYVCAHKCVYVYARIDSR